MIHITDGQTGILLGSLEVFDNDTIDEGVTGLKVLRFSVKSYEKDAEHLKDLNRLLARHEREGWQEFVVHETAIDKDDIFVVAVGSETSINGRKVISPATYDGWTLKQFDVLATSGTEWTSGYVEYAGFKTMIIDKHTQPFEFINQVGETFKTKSIFRVEVKGSRVIGRYIDRLKRIGEGYRGKEFTDAKDIIGLKKTIYNDRILTGLHIIGPVKEDGTHIETYISDSEAFQRWNSFGLPIIKVYEPKVEDNEITLEGLIELGEAELKKRINSVVEYAITVADLAPILGHEATYLGDDVRIKDTDFNPPLYATSRIINVKRPVKRGDDENPVEKTYTIGEVVEYKEEDVLRTFRALQRLYGTKLIKGPVEPPGQSKTIWIDTSGPLDVPYTYNAQTSQWEKYAPTDAGEIGGLVVGQQYNGVSITPEDGLVVDRTDGLVETIINATEGITIQSRPTDLDLFKKVFFANEFGYLTFAGIARGAQIYLGGLDNEDGVLIIYGADGIPVGEINSATGTFNFPSLSVGELFAPNAVTYADYRNENRLIYVAAESASGISEPSDDNTGESWSSPLRTISEAIRRIPLSFKGVVEILVAINQTFNEDVEITGFSGGGTLIIRKSADSTRAKVAGSVRIVSNVNFIEWRDINLDSTDPYAGFFCRGSSGVISNVNANGASGDTTNAININSDANFEIYGVAHSNCVTAVRASYGGNAHVSDNTGSVSGVALVAFGGTITGGGTAPTGAGGDKSEIQGGKAPGTWTFPTPPVAPAPIATTTKQTWSALSDSGTYRTDFGGFWDSGSNYGNYATQGKWDIYGIFTGSWFFGSGLSTAVAGKTIKSIRIYASRVSGGSGSSVSVKFRPHTSTSRPSGNVSLQSPEYSVGFNVESKWITLPTSFHAGFASGAYKGISVYSGTSNYAKMKKTLKIEITYQ